MSPDLPPPLTAAAPTAAETDAVLQSIEALGGQLRRVREGVGRIIYGQTEVIDQTLISLLSGGHLLLVGLPGLAKTKLVDTLGTVLGLIARKAWPLDKGPLGTRWLLRRLVRS